MKQLFVTIAFSFPTFVGMSQNIDSILKIPQVLELSISTPQPRLKEKVKISLDANFVRVHIFKSTFGQFEFVEDVGNTDDGIMSLNVTATQKGKNKIGPLSFTINGTKCSTNQIEYEVIDPLPNVDKGLWFRKIFTNDSTFCIIIEQRIPANSKTIKISDKKTKYLTEPISENVASFKYSYSINGLRGRTSTTYSDFGSIYDDKGNEKKFMTGYSISYFSIIDKKAKIKITKDKFQNLPTDYKFEDIIVQ